MKLYRVSTPSFEAYVVAKTPTEAEKEFAGWLESEDYGYYRDRIVVRIELIADTNSKPNSTLYPCDLLLGGIIEDE